MKNPKRNEMVIMGCCGKSHKSYGITVRQDVVHDDAFPGCPYCGNNSWWQCGNCGCIVCMDENNTKTMVKCPRCGNEGELEYTKEFTFKGGAM